MKKFYGYIFTDIFLHKYKEIILNKFEWKKRFPMNMIPEWCHNAFGH